MSAGGVAPSGSSRHVRLDPFGLPVRFRTTDEAADTRERTVELGRDTMVLRRAVAGMRMKVAVPVASFLGVALRVVPPDDTGEGSVAVVLEHRDPGLTVPLFVADDGTDAVAEWQLWANVLGLPLLVAETDGTLREPFARLGGVRLGTPQVRRRRSSPVKRRRASILMRRKPGRLPVAPHVYKDEQEIIARS
ncbi:DUF6101 family protein [Rhodoplanes sp. TEM]|uniref:DUF6101 family protein n=1 Tax=Rhodoplanes tepidamans TaxID=200616 RepID=A0ABT5J4G0_RHOTP|nr:MULTISPECIES: DUF6101 family protein [Rhodoplanes]MDC7784528.1 DUF6101 family protein [Rhodoplanes tepidamans]MDC7984435.1 DUF6101 family protein [Rhodoplanes sp. TEM]MDQ0355756.1 hypothetical protein [Rhodoplanes tepidamans]